MTTIALGIPHTPWISERRASMGRLRDQLRPHEGLGGYREFTDREPNAAWSEKMWRWGLDTGADFFLTLQDDAEVSPAFWPALRAQLVHLPRGAALGLSSVHPVQEEIRRRGERWYRTQSWLVGWAYGFWREDLEEFLRWRAAGPVLMTEDSLVNHWIATSGRSTWHPVPATVDHDTTIASSYGNDHHVHRRPFVTWRDVDADLTAPEFWRPSGTPTLLPLPRPRHCWGCLKRPEAVQFPTGMSLCPTCLGGAVNAFMAQVEAQ